MDCMDMDCSDQYRCMTAIIILYGRMGVKHKEGGREGEREEGREGGRDGRWKGGKNHTAPAPFVSAITHNPLSPSPTTINVYPPLSTPTTKWVINSINCL